MAYDNAGGTHDTEPTAEEKAQGASKAKIPQFNSDPGQLEWHEAITKFALETKQLHPSQFQLAMKRFTPVKSIGGKQVETGQGGNVPTPDRQNARCKLLRTYRSGLILFAMGAQPNFDRLKEMDAILNAGPDGNRITAAKIGQPMQVPLDAKDAGPRVGVK
jgi:hypothetical protein